MNTFALLLTSIVSSATVLGAEKAFTELTDKTFTNFIRSSPVVFVDFYADWCSHCKAFEPVFEEIAEHFKGKIPVGRINAPNYMDLSLSQGINSLPTIRLYIDEEMHDYHGPRNFNDLVEFITKSTTPVVHELKTAEEINNFVNEHPINFIGCFDESNTEAKELYKDTAKSLNLIINNAYFGEIPANLKDTLQLSKCPSVIAHSLDFVPAEFELSSDTEEDTLRKWIIQNSLPALDEITEDNMRLYYESGLPMVWLVLQSPSTSTLEWVRDIALQYVGKLTFLWLDNFDGSDQSKLLGHTYKGPYPAVVITHGQEKYVLPSLTALKLSPVVMDQFVSSYLDGSLPKQRSQPIPRKEENEGKPVKRIVNYNFEDVIFNPSKDVVVLFYQSDCDYCQDVRPLFEETSRRLPYVESLVFAEFDQTFNDVPEFTEIRMYPSIALFSLDSKDKPLLYTGNETSDDLIKFLQENVGIKFEYDEFYGDTDDDDEDEEDEEEQAKEEKEEL